MLNLNKTRLKENRAAALEGVEEQLNKKPGSRTKAEIQSIIDKYSVKEPSGRFKEYYGCLLFYLTKKLRKAN